MSEPRPTDDTFITWVDAGSREAVIQVQEMVEQGNENLELQLHAKELLEDVEGDGLEELVELVRNTRRRLSVEMDKQKTFSKRVSALNNSPAN